LLAHFNLYNFGKLGNCCENRLLFDKILLVRGREALRAAYGAKKAMIDLTTCGQVRPTEKPLRHRAARMGFLARDVYVLVYITFLLRRLPNL
jgi:hypothetical protein